MCWEDVASDEAELVSVQCSAVKTRERAQKNGLCNCGLGRLKRKLLNRDKPGKHRQEHSKGYPSNNRKLNAASLASLKALICLQLPTSFEDVCLRLAKPIRLGIAFSMACKLQAALQSEHDWAERKPT